MARWRWKDALAALRRREAAPVVAQPHVDVRPAPEPVSPPEPVDLRPVAWPWDPVFRPVVGVFADGRLVGVLPTVRRPTGEPGQAAGWSCLVDHAAAVRLAGAALRVELRCLETDERLTETDDAPAGRPDARVLIALSRRHGVPPRLDGFTAFLRLPIAEQLSLTFFAILGRPAQEGDRAMVHAVFHREGGSVLDLRDRLLTNRDFVEGRMATVVPPYGHWLCWPGLAAASDHLLVAPAVSLPGLWRPPSDLAALPPAAFATALARMALGRGAAAELAARWSQDHAPAVAELYAALAPRRRGEDGMSPSSTVFDFGHALGGMAIGAGGRRHRTAVLIRPQHVGDILYGPYAKLAPGRYSVSLRLKAYAAESRPGLLFLEIVAAEVVLAGMSVRVGAAVTDVVTLAFTVPAGLPVITASGIEYRLRSDGRVGGLVEDVRVRRLSRTGAEALAVPEVDDWLPLLQVGGAGVDAAGGIAGPVGLSGHVFYGPHRALLPGCYRLVVTLRATHKVDGGGSVLLDVVDRDQKALASDHIALGEGVSSLSLLFTVEEPTDSALPGKLEFRLRKEAGCDLLVTSVRVVAPSAGPPDAPPALTASAGAG